jgi:hypothetical protein
MNGRVRCVLLSGVALAGCLVWQPLSALAAPSARVDLNLYYDEPVIAAGGQGVQTFTVANSGADATSPVDLTVSTPAFVAVDPASDLPPNCAFLYRDADADDTVPELIRCVVAPLRHGESVSIPFTLTVDGAAAAGTTYGEATALPAAGSTDIDQNMADNLGWPSVVVSGQGTAVSGPTTGHVTDLYLTTDLPAVAVGAPATETLTVGDRGPQPTAGPVRLLLVTPPLVRVDDAVGLPAGCGFRYDTTDPAAPQVIGCTVAAPLAVGGQAVVRIPLSVVFGSPVQTSWGIADVFPDHTAGSTDIDPVPANNLVESGVQVVG